MGKIVREVGVAVLRGFLVHIERRGLLGVTISIMGILLSQ